MGQPWPNMDRIEKAAILFAAFLHVIFFEIFAISIPVRPVMQKPFFIFLGAFLESQDFPGLTPRNPLQNQPLEIPLITPESYLVEKARKEMAAKPDWSRKQAAKRKEFPKMTFLEDNQEAKNSKIKMKMAEELGIDLHPPVRKPLKLFIE